MLWVVHELDRKWLLLQKRKSAIQAYYNKRFKEESCRIYDETRLSFKQDLFKSIVEALRLAESEREVDDVDSKFNLHFPPGEAGVNEGQYRRPNRKSLYSMSNKAGLWEIASKFGYSSEQFGALISLEVMTSLHYFSAAFEYQSYLTSYHIPCRQEWMNPRIQRRLLRILPQTLPVQCLIRLKLF